MQKRFKDVAAQLKTLAPTASLRGSEQQQAALDLEAISAQKCGAVVDSCVPLADFFAQLRAGNQSHEFAKCAFEGLATGLQRNGASEALQVSVADALYMLVGVTPVNSGVEVLHMIEAWRSHNLTIGSSIVMEIEYISQHIYNEASSLN